jgi:hypothetical protein
MDNVEFSIDCVANANKKSRAFAIKKLIDIDGTEYEATAENMREFISDEDAEQITKEINSITKKKQSKTQ